MALADAVGVGEADVVGILKVLSAVIGELCDFNFLFFELYVPHVIDAMVATTPLLFSLIIAVLPGFTVMTEPKTLFLFVKRVNLK